MLTNSAVTLHWIQNVNRTYKQYVQHRVNEIRRQTPPASWRHVPGQENVADLPSRGCTPDQLEKQKDYWFKGVDVTRYIQMASEDGRGVRITRSNKDAM